VLKSIYRKWTGLGLSKQILVGLGLGILHLGETPPDSSTDTQ
jgi:hypothetical protein